MSTKPALPPLGPVVVGTDFSAHAQQAVRRALSLPLARGSSVTLVHALPPGLPADVEARLRAASGALMRAAKEAAVAAAERAQQRDVDVLTVIDVGRPVELVARRAEDERAELVVIGRGQPRTVGERLLGSSAEQIVRAAPTSVLVVAGDVEGPYRRAIAGVDVSEPSQLAVETALRLVPGEVTVVHAYQAPFADMTPDRVAPPMSSDETLSYLEVVERAARARLRTWMAGIDLEAVLVHGDPRRALLEQARQRRAELIVVGHHDRSILGRIFLGSVATAVVRAASYDVLVAR